MQEALINLRTELHAIAQLRHNYSGKEFDNFCLECERTPWQENEINRILKKYSLDPREVWSRFERRARRLNSNTCNCDENPIAHEFRRGADFLHMIAEIWAEGRLPEGFLRLNLTAFESEEDPYRNR